MLLAAYLPMMGGIGKTRKLANPDLEEMWVDSLKLMRFGGQALVVIGMCATAYMMGT
ncbi:MAG: hypothetical protein H0U59_13575 [Gemmatimonadaceae bacterium]|nr:hypothetical protein [Gemmatimonadaceae bacterium]